MLPSLNRAKRMDKSMSRVIQRRSSWQIQVATVRALFFRELQGRFGAYDLRLGYLWLVLSPGLQVLMMVLIFSFIKIRVVPDINFTLFLVTGIIPWMMFSNCAARALGAVEANMGLFNYRPVLPIDTVIARTLLELFLNFTVFLLFVAAMLWFGIEISASHIPMLLVTWFFLWLFSFGFSLIMMVVGHWSSEIGQFVSILIRIMYFTSGILYSLHILPQEYLKYILWNPIPHALEYMRHAVAPTYSVMHVSYFYFLCSVLVCLFVGILLYRANERSMMTSR